jgi:methanogenic corrinoid protein MtbC1
MISRSDEANDFELQLAHEELIPQNSIAEPGVNPVSFRQGQVTSLAQAALRFLAGKSMEGTGISPRLSEQYVDAFCRILVMGRLREALNLARLFAARGADYGVVAEDLFAAAARRLGEKWETDQASMVDVNIGVSTLIRTHVALCANAGQPLSEYRGSALFSSFEGQAHTLGLVLAVEYFRHNGWTVRHMPGTTLKELMPVVATEAPNLVGMTAASDTDLGLLRSVIDQLREIPSQPRIIVGGSSPNLASIGADAIVTQLDMALMAGNTLLE